MMNKQVSKKSKLYLCIFGSILVVSFFEIIVGLIMWIWTGWLGFKIFLSCVFLTLFFHTFYNELKKEIEIKERLEND